MGRKFSIWLLLALPTLPLTYQWLEGTASYGQTLHRTGLISVFLMFTAMAVTPIRKLIPRVGTAINHHRRALGVASFAYATMHTAVYLEYKWGADLIAQEATHADLALGWLAFALLSVLALTSNAYSTRRLGPNWQRLHRTVYLAALLTATHWALASFSATTAILCSALLLSIQAIRLKGQTSSGSPT